MRTVITSEPKDQSYKSPGFTKGDILKPRTFLERKNLFGPDSPVKTTEGFRRTALPGTMKINVKLFNGDTFSMNIRQDQPISTITKQVETTYNIPQDIQFLYYKGNRLNNKNTLTFYNIPNKAIIFIGQEGSNVIEMQKSSLKLNILIEMSNDTRSTQKITSFQNPPQISQLKSDISGTKLEYSITPTKGVFLNMTNGKYWPNYGSFGYWTWHKEAKKSTLFFASPNPKEQNVRQAIYKTTRATLQLGYAVGKKVLPFVAPGIIAYYSLAGTGTLASYITKVTGVWLAGWAANMFTKDNTNESLSDEFEIIRQGTLGQVAEYWKKKGADFVRNFNGVDIAPLDKLFKSGKLNESQILEKMQNMESTPFKIAEVNNVTQLLKQKYNLRTLTEDDLFIIQGQDPARLVITSNIFIEDQLEKMQNDTDINLSEWTKDYGSRFFPYHYYQLTYLMNIDSDQNVDMMDGPHNSIATLRNQGKIYDQFVKLFDNVDLWVRLEPPNRTSYSESPEKNTVKSTTPFKDTTIIRIGPQEFYFTPVEDDKDKTWKWTFNANDLNIVMNDGQLHNLDKKLIESGKPKKDLYVGQLLGYPFKPPNVVFPYVHDYYLKVRKTDPSWIRLQQPLKQFEDTPLNLIIRDQNRKLDMNFISEKYHKISSVKMTDEERKTRATKLIKGVQTQFVAINRFMSEFNDTQTWEVSDKSFSATLSIDKNHFFEPKPYPLPPDPMKYPITYNPAILTPLEEYKRLQQNYNTLFVNSETSGVEIPLFQMTNHLESSTDALKNILSGVTTIANTLVADKPLIPGRLKSLQTQINSFESSVKHIIPLTEIQKDKQINAVIDLLFDFQVEISDKVKKIYETITTDNFIETQLDNFNIRQGIQIQLENDKQTAEKIFETINNNGIFARRTEYKKLPHDEKRGEKRANMMSIIQILRGDFEKLLGIQTTLRLIAGNITQYYDRYPALKISSDYKLKVETLILNRIDAINNKIDDMWAGYLDNVNPETINPSNIKGLGWLNYSYKFTRGGTKRTLPDGTTTFALDDSDIRELAAAQVIFKSEGVLMMETLLDYIKNPRRAPFRWFDGIPKITTMRQFGKLQRFSQSIRWLAIQKNQEAIHNILSKFVFDEITNPLLVRQGIKQLVRLILPTHKRQWTTSNQSQIVRQFEDDLDTSAAPQATMTVSQIPASTQPSLQDIKITGGAHHEGGAHHKECNTCNTKPKVYSLFGGGTCKCSDTNAKGGAKESYFEMFDKQLKTQRGGQLTQPTQISQPHFHTPAIKLPTIDPDKIDGAVSKLIDRLMSKENIRKEQIFTQQGDPLLTLEAGKQFYNNVIEPLLRLNSVRKRITWLNKSGNNKTTKLFAAKLWNEAKSKRKIELAETGITEFVGLFQPEGFKRYSKAAEEFSLAGIVEEFTIKAEQNPQAAARELVKRVTLESEAVEAESTYSADDVEKNLDIYLNQLARKTNDQKRIDFIMDRSSSFQIVWTNYVKEFSSDKEAVDRKLSRMINMFRHARKEKIALITGFWANADDFKKIAEAVNQLIIQLIGRKISIPSERKFDPSELQKDRREKGHVEEGGPESLREKTQEQKSELGEQEKNTIIEWIYQAVSSLRKTLETYKSSFDRQAPKIASTIQADSKASRYKRAFLTDKSKKKRELDTKKRQSKNLSSSNKTEIDSVWKEEMRGLDTELEGYIKEFKEEVRNNAALKRAGITPDSQKGWWDWGKDRVLGKPSTDSYKELQRKMQMQMPGRTTDKRTFEDILRKKRTGQTALPPGPIGAMPPRPTMADLQREATKPGFATYKDPVTGLTKTMAVTRFPMDTPADYARLQKAIMTLDPSKIKHFMSKLGDIAGTLPAAQASKILTHFQRRVLNELDKYCIRQGWMLFDEHTNKCI